MHYLALALSGKFDLIHITSGKVKRHRSALVCDADLLISACGNWENIARVIDFQYRTEKSITMLLHTATDRQQLFIWQPETFGIEFLHRLQSVGEQSDIDEIFRKFHR